MGSVDLPSSVLSHAWQVAAAIERRIRELGGRAVRVDADEIITGRAALLGLPAPGRISAGGASRLLAAADGWCAFTLSRPEDYEALPALLESSGLGDDPWGCLAAGVAARPAAELVARARLLDMPAAVLGEIPVSEPKVEPHNAPASRPITDLLVADLSSMWAGPLCGRLLAAAGATVVKLETPNRPDGTRSGHRGFFDWLNAEKLCYSGDFRRLLQAADVVIEGSRPSALARRGLAAEQVPARPGRIWLRLSGYGSAYPERVAFGDDAAVAGGLVTSEDDGPLFCGDAIADPLSGLAATAAVLDALAAGGGVVVDMSMGAVAAVYAALPADDVTCCGYRPPVVTAHAHEVGADNARVREMIESRLVAC
ncbi:MAG: CoA transferase [Mycobacterium sp.]